MKTTRNVLSLALVLVLVLLPAFFSAGTKEAAQGTVTLKLEQFSGSEATLSGEALKGMIAEFEKQNPTIKVELQTIGYDDYFTQLQSKVVGGQRSRCVRTQL